MKNLYKYLFGLGVSFNLFFNKVFAQNNIPSPPPGEAITLQLLEQWVARIYKFALTVGGVIIFIFLVYAGIMYAVAGGDEKRIEKAKGILKGAIIGAIIFLGVSTILFTIARLVTGGTFD